MLCDLPSENSVISPTGIPPDILHTIEIRRVPLEVERIINDKTTLANSVTPAFISGLMEEQYTRLRSLYEPTTVGQSQKQL